MAPMCDTNNKRGVLYSLYGQEEVCIDKGSRNQGLKAPLLYYYAWPSYMRITV